MIAIPVKNQEENPEIDERFGRCNMFCIIDNTNYKFIENRSKDNTSGAGGESVKLLADEDVTTIISPHIGPKAMDAINALKMEVFNMGDSKTVSDALENLKNGKLEKVDPAKKGLRRV